MFYMCTCSLLLHSDVLILIQLRQQRGPSQDPKTGVRQTGQPYPHDKICTLTRRRQHPSSFTGFVHRAVVRLCPSLLLCRLLLLNNSRTHTKEQHNTLHRGFHPKKINKTRMSDDFVGDVDPPHKQCSTLFTYLQHRTFDRFDPNGRTLAKQFFWFWVHEHVVVKIKRSTVQKQSVCNKNK